MLYPVQDLFRAGKTVGGVTLKRALFTSTSSAYHNSQNRKPMSSRGRSLSPRPLDNGDVDMENDNAKTVIVNNLTRNVVESHLRTIFGHYGEITKIDLPVYGKCAWKCYLCSSVDDLRFILQPVKIEERQL